MDDILDDMDSAVALMRERHGDPFTIGFLTDLLLRHARTSVGLRVELRAAIGAIHRIAADSGVPRRPVRDTLSPR